MIENESIVHYETTIERYNQLKIERKISEEFRELVVNQIDELKNQFQQLNQKIISKENDKQNNENENENQKKIITSNKNEINNIENKNNLNNKIEKDNLKNIISFKAHNDQINLISIFPSGNLISISNDYSINIYTDTFELIQNIQNAHDDWITYIDIKDDNNFVTCSYDQNIITWIKINNTFKENIIIEDAHDHYINKVNYCYNGHLISCSWDKDIKIWELKNNEYICIRCLYHNYYIKTILVIEEQNILFSSGRDGTKIWLLNMKNNLRNAKLINYLNDASCFHTNNLCRIGYDKVIIGKFRKLFIYSISEGKIVIEIKLPEFCYSVKVFENKGVFLVGCKNDILIYKINNYECINVIKNAHLKIINGFVELKNGNIASFSDDGEIKIWSLER